VLSINRTGYAGNPIPDTPQPVLDSVPLYSSLIKKAYEEHSNGKHGIVLIGHSLGAVTALSIAAFKDEELPLLGVSALGIIPAKDHPAGLVDMLRTDPENPRFVVEPSPEAIETFMGPPSVIDPEMLVHPSVPQIFEPGKRTRSILCTRVLIASGLKSELLEWWGSAWYNRFVNEVAPGVRVRWPCFPEPLRLI
jgi:pimeloyl-ACP methyl ester carboxylesterase